jgi:hypothetical protein
VATGDQADIESRLQQVTPFGWFPLGLTPLRDACYAGLANAYAFIYSLLAYVRLQTRVATATDGFLDLIANDFFGDGLLRQANEADGAYRARIQTALLRERATRRAVILVLQQLTGRTPVIIEPRMPGDTGAYHEPGWGYRAAGYWGSRSLPFQIFVIAYRPPQNGIPNVSGYGISFGGYGVGSQLEYASLAQIQNQVTDASIYAAINSVRPAGVRIWVSIQN